MNIDDSIRKNLFVEKFYLQKYLEDSGDLRKKVKYDEFVIDFGLIFRSRFKSMFSRNFNEFFYLNKFFDKSVIVFSPIAAEYKFYGLDGGFKFKDIDKHKIIRNILYNFYNFYYVNRYEIIKIFWFIYFYFCFQNNFISSSSDFFSDFFVTVVKNKSVNIKEINFDFDSIYKIINTDPTLNIFNYIFNLDYFNRIVKILMINFYRYLSSFSFEHLIFVNYIIRDSFDFFEKLKLDFFDFRIDSVLFEIMIKLFVNYNNGVISAFGVKGVNKEQISGSVDFYSIGSFYLRFYNYCFGYFMMFEKIENQLFSMLQALESIRINKSVVNIGDDTNVSNYNNGVFKFGQSVYYNYEFFIKFIKLNEVNF